MKTIRNCRVSFAFKCPKDWENLSATDNSKVRFCDVCSENVFFCETDEETIANALDGKCIARSEPDEEELAREITIGRPSIEFMRKDILTRHHIRRERTIDEAIAIEDFEICNRCGYPKQKGSVSCEVCRCG